ncbi:MAG TPA: thiamine pyrophosphate-binding protein [Candidatus Dormibacteraeota bacterium]|nr:thiamine pyrophosphate-binding protein [Candidatus Dormibacteraeota bacterium]
MSGTHALLELLKQEDVDIVFGNPGTTELPLIDALAIDHDVRYVLGLQEAAVMAMADGYAQASGSLAVVNLHLAPGLGNAMGMLYNAHKAASPVIITAGQHEQSFSATEPILWAELSALARPFVKWAGEVRRLSDLPRLVHRAAKTALAPPTGPVFLSLPSDILTSEGDVDLQAPTRVAPRLRGDRAAVDAAAALLSAAERPLIIVGDAVAQSRAHAELAELAELLGAPVYAELLPSTASFPTSHPLFHGALTPRAPAIRQVLDQHDVLLSVGADLFTLSLPSEVEPIPAGMPLIHLDVDAWELGKNYPASVAILGDPKGTLPELTAAVSERMTSNARSAAQGRLRTARDSIRAARASLISEARGLATQTPIQPLALLHAIGEMLPKDAVVVAEATSSARGIHHLIRSDDPQSFFGLRGGGVGWGLPAAIGVKLALPDRPVVALLGDGGAMYTCQALWTAAHHRIGVVFVILNNASYRILKQRLYAFRGHAAEADNYGGLELVDPLIDFVGLARSLGVVGERARTAAAATELIGRGLAGDRPMLIDVELDRAFKPRDERGGTPAIGATDQVR